MTSYFHQVVRHAQLTNMKVGIFTGGTSVRSKNIFTDNSRYPTGKHEIKQPTESVCALILRHATIDQKPKISTRKSAVHKNHSSSTLIL